MRTTLTIDDQLARALKSLAHHSDKPFKDVVNDTLRRGLTAAQALSEARSYSAPSYSMGQVAGGLNLDKALALAERLEDEEVARKLSMNK
jgi:hypothetical protein